MTNKNFKKIQETIFFDTGGLQEATRSAPFKLLLDLSKNGDIRLVIPYIAFGEWRTQWRDNLKKQFEDVQRNTKSLSTDLVFNGKFREDLKAASEATPNVDDFEKLSFEEFEKLKAEFNIEVWPLNIEQTTAAFKKYFLGESPFKKVKNRNDIPDSLIFEAAKEVIKKYSSMICVVDDEELEKALINNLNVKTFSNPSELIKSPHFQAIIKTCTPESEWSAAKHKFRFLPDLIKDESIDFVQSNIWSLIEYKTIVSNVIPEDNNEAIISSYGDPENITIGEEKHYGRGMIIVPVTFECVVGVYFYVYRSNSFHVPDWVHVSYGDFEKDHYFQAEAEIKIEVSFELEILFNIVSGSEDNIVESASCDGPVNIRVIDPPEES